MNILEERERVAEMCSWCDVDSMVIDGKRQYCARMWCNAIGEKVVGYGDTAWEAVQAAHALYDMASKG
jgi:hypothetical protein